MERIGGIEPPQLAWEARALPLSYTRRYLFILVLCGLFCQYRKDMNEHKKGIYFVYSLARKEDLNNSPGLVFKVRWTPS